MSPFTSRRIALVATLLLSAVIAMPRAHAVAKCGAGPITIKKIVLANGAAEYFFFERGVACGHVVVAASQSRRPQRST